MKRLKLQMQISVDGFVAGPKNEMDWMVWDWDDDLKHYVNELTDSVDTILLGRKMADGFVTHWSNVVKNAEDPSHPFARKMVDKPKVVFTKTLEKSSWENTKLAKGQLSDEINKVKKQNGKDIIVYGGASFVSSLIKEKLIDEFHLFVNPAILGKGLTIFKSVDEKQNLKLVRSISFPCGIVLLNYAT
jgi:dihydrofolate reductase